MTRTNSAFLLRRASERALASLAALALTVLMLFSVNAQAATPAPSVTEDTLTPSVSILVPTVTIEVVSE